MMHRTRNMAAFCRSFSRTLLMKNFWRLSSSPKLFKSTFSYSLLTKMHGQAKFSRKSTIEATFEANDTDCGENVVSASTNPHFVHPDERTIFVAKLNPIATKKSLKDYFAQFGEVEEVFMKPPRKFKQIWPYAHVQFKDVSSMEKVLTQRHFIHMRYVQVDPAFNKYSPKKICIYDVPENLEKTVLKAHFSQYGNIKKVEEFYRIKPYYCFIKFTTSDAVLKALERPIVKIGDSEVLVKKCIENAQKTHVKRRVFINDVPEGLTLEHLKDYFGYFGSLAFIDMIFLRNHKERRDMAMVAFFDDAPVKKIEKTMMHSINGEEVRVQRATSLDGNKERHVQIFVDKIPGCVKREELTHYFEGFNNDVIHISTKRWGAERNFQSAFIKFKKRSTVHKIMARGEHSIGGRHFIVKRFGWSAERR
ncbi:polyadenylate-binding protein, cytoplasmic and nuclear-like [Stylophora pistillata]|uniref:polyadenylate-binding protein, cytoplasmic and nuclear-like n=1 Tax=Stylophora pistillata TaxID=50429 RepID=UPI000C04DB72|nr:polyadenylate-binding protein, cytoplasmic and nuclear-like [Stylophora pistillata]